MQGFYYEAQFGDTLESVARRYGLAPAKLRQANGLDTTTAPGSGQLLFVPAQQAVHHSKAYP